jgi:Phosphatidylinositol-glycan biosynthesis class S protein
MRRCRWQPPVSCMCDLTVEAPSFNQPFGPHCTGDLSPTDSYVIPSWGGVVIFNPPDSVAGAESPERPATSVLSSVQLSGALNVAKRPQRLTRPHCHTAPRRPTCVTPRMLCSSIDARCCMQGFSASCLHSCVSTSACQTAPAPLAAAHQVPTALTAAAGRTQVPAGRVQHMPR